MPTFLNNRVRVRDSFETTCVTTVAANVLMYEGRSDKQLDCREQVRHPISIILQDIVCKGEKEGRCRGISHCLEHLLWPLYTGPFARGSIWSEANVAVSDMTNFGANNASITSKLTKNRGRITSFITLNLKGGSRQPVEINLR